MKCHNYFMPFLLVAAAFLAAVSGEAANKYEKKVEQFEASDRTNPPPKNAVLFVGSSSIENWTNLASSFPELKTIRRGIGGTHVSDMIEFADRIVTPYHPSKILFYAGDNDIAAKKTPERVLNDYKKFVRKVRAKLPNVEIYFLPIKASPSRASMKAEQMEANRLVREFSKGEKGLHYIDTWTPMLGKDGEVDPQLFVKDKLHMNQKGYVIWTKVVREALGLK